MIVSDNTTYGMRFVTFKARRDAKQKVTVNINDDGSIYFSWSKPLSEAELPITGSSVDELATIDDAKDFAHALDEAINYVKRLQE